jgi:hypothetical protein
MRKKKSRGHWKEKEETTYRVKKQEESRKSEEYLPFPIVWSRGLPALSGGPHL